MVAMAARLFEVVPREPIQRPSATGSPLIEAFRPKLPVLFTRKLCIFINKTLYRYRLSLINLITLGYRASSTLVDGLMATNWVFYARSRRTVVARYQRTVCGRYRRAKRLKVSVINLCAARCRKFGNWN